jgi:peptidoglycan/LPS O-acetylase OafA/YrhL
VVFYHFFPNLVKSGFVGVDIFFVISGYLIGGILLDKLYSNSTTNQDRPSTVSFSTYLLDFYARRIRRILPALILVMLVSLAFGWFALLPDDYERLGKHTLGGATFVSNIVLWIESWSDAGYWDVESHRKVLLHLWSLGVEEQFYLCFPLALWFIYVKKLKTTIVLATVALISFVISLGAYYTHHFNIGFWTPAARFWELLLGSILAAYLREANLNKPSDFLLNLFSCLGFCLLLYSVFALSSNGFPNYAALSPTVGTAMLIYVGSFSKTKPLYRVLSFRPIVGVGLISYPLYLWHWVLLSFAWIIVGGWETKGFELIGFRALLILIAFVLSILTYYLIEKPIRFGKKRKGLKAVVLLIALVVVGAVGGTLCAKNGAPFARGTINENDMRVIKEIIAKPSFWMDKTNEKICKQKFKATKGCQYADAFGSETIALVGDSHADCTFDTVAEFNKQRGVNTLLLSAAGIANPIMGEREYTEETLTNLTNEPSIRKVFIIFRGAAYLSGFDANQNNFPIIGEENYKSRLQYFVDRLNETNKHVYIVGENPELINDIRYMIKFQPLRPTRDQLQFNYKQDVLDRQKNYLEILPQIKGATIIYVINAFCPEDKCRIFDDNGAPLYYDDDHLSVNAGGRFLVEKVLKPYLDE